MKRRMYANLEYWCRPVPSFGDPKAGLLIIGLAPAAHGANRTGRMFTGDRSGDFLFNTLHKLGFANSPSSRDRTDGLTLRDTYITAALRCAPPTNKPLNEELTRCRPYLVTELSMLSNTKVVVVLGKVAFDSYLSACLDRGISLPTPRPRFGHGTSFTTPDGIKLISSYHPSQQNTQTGRLTAEMFEEVFANAKYILEISYWTSIMAKCPELSDNPEGIEQFASMFVGKYLPAVLRSKYADDRQRVWLAFWSYITARPTVRKPFSISDEAADRLIVDFQNNISPQINV